MKDLYHGFRCLYPPIRILFFSPQREMTPGKGRRVTGGILGFTPCSQHAFRGWALPTDSSLSDSKGPGIPNEAHGTCGIGQADQGTKSTRHHSFSPSLCAAPFLSLKNLRPTSIGSPFFAASANFLSKGQADVRNNWQTGCSLSKEQGF